MSLDTAAEERQGLKSKSRTIYEVETQKDLSPKSLKILLEEWDYTYNKESGEFSVFDKADQSSFRVEIENGDGVLLIHAKDDTTEDSLRVFQNLISREWGIENIESY